MAEFAPNGFPPYPSNIYVANHCACSIHEPSKFAHIGPDEVSLWPCTRGGRPPIFGTRSLKVPLLVFRNAAAHQSTHLNLDATNYSRFLILLTVSTVNIPCRSSVMRFWYVWMENGIRPQLRGKYYLSAQTRTTSTSLWSTSLSMETTNLTSLGKKLDDFTANPTPLMKSTSNSGPNTGPCRSPLMTLSLSEHLRFILT